ncbi:MAG: CPBP family intramembrane metalloprotease [Lentilactobacillus diolivorans]|nr:CPBP family intramembrane metalloprotease [Lentilactobacillus diolivorans]RRG04060.1 MAG: CPBP family intramembrane metalloprotease [Lactobacillus sp.]
MTRSNRLNLFFGIGSLVYLVLGIIFYYLKITRYFVSMTNPILIALVFISALIIASNYFANRSDIVSKSIQIILKIVNYLFYIYFLTMIINAILEIVWRQTQISPTVFFYLGIILLATLSVPLLSKLVISEENNILRMIGIFLFYYMIITTPLTLKIGRTWFPDLALVTLLSFIFGSALVIFAMRKWGYRFPRFKINHNVNYWWLAGLILPSFLFMGFSVGSWTRLLSTPFTINLIAPFPEKSVLPVVFYVICTILMTCFKEELIFRYLFLAQLLNIQKGNSKRKVLKSVLISSLLFGLWHLKNLNHQPLFSTLLQTLAAFALGMIFSLVCLYTGTIWITVIMHSIFDLFMIDRAIPISPFQAQPNAFFVEYIILAAIIEIGLVLFILNKINLEPFEQTIRENRFLKVSN